MINLKLALFLFTSIGFSFFKFQVDKPKHNEAYELNIDKKIIYKNLQVDSVIAVDYLGFHGEQSFYPVDDMGKLHKSLKKVLVLSKKQGAELQALFGDKESFKDPKIIACFEPRMGLIYFKNGSIVAQSQLCLSCARIRSTAQLGNLEHYASFNEATLTKLDKLCRGLEFSNCSPW